MENLVLSAAGCLAGLVLARWAAGMLGAFVPRTPFPIHFDARVNADGVLFAMGLTVITALVSGVIPALRASPRSGRAFHYHYLGLHTSWRRDQDRSPAPIRADGCVVC